MAPDTPSQGPGASWERLGESESRHRFASETHRARNGFPQRPGDVANGARGVGNPGLRARPGEGGGGLQPRAIRRRRAPSPPQRGQPRPQHQRRRGQGHDLPVQLVDLHRGPVAPLAVDHRVRGQVVVQRVGHARLEHRDRAHVEGPVDPVRQLVVPEVVRRRAPAGPRDPERARIRVGAVDVVAEQPRRDAEREGHRDHVVVVGIAAEIDPRRVQRRLARAVRDLQPHHGQRQQPVLGDRHVAHVDEAVEEIRLVVHVEVHDRQRRRRRGGQQAGRQGRGRQSGRPVAHHRLPSACSIVDVTLTPSRHAVDPEVAAPRAVAPAGAAPGAANER